MRRLSITTFINTAIVLDNAILYGAEMGHLNNDTLVLNDALCVLNLLLCGYAIWVAYTGLRPSEAPQPEKAEPSVPPAYERMLLSPRDARLHLTLRDYLVMGRNLCGLRRAGFCESGQYRCASNWLGVYLARRADRL